MATETLDTKGLNCPMPILKAKRAMKGLGPGDTLEIEATDPGSVKDFEAFCRATGNELLETGEDSGVYHFLLRKGSRFARLLSATIGHGDFFRNGLLAHGVFIPESVDVFVRDLVLVQLPQAGVL